MSYNVIQCSARTAARIWRAERRAGGWAGEPARIQAHTLAAEGRRRAAASDERGNRACPRGPRMVFDWLRGHAAAKPKRKTKLRRFCARCGAIVPGRHTRHRYCSQTCWRRRSEFGAVDVVAGIHRATNAERGAAMKNPVRRDSFLDAIAQAHAADMARRGYYAHRSPDGTTDTGRAMAAGYPHKWAPAGRVWIMDNIWKMPRSRCNSGLARTAVRTWLGSPGHRANMLDGRHARLGVGVAVSRRGTIYFVQAFC